MSRNADNLRDLLQLYGLLADRIDFDKKWALNFVRVSARNQADFFSQRADVEGSSAALRFWKEITPWHRRLRSHIGRLIRHIVD